MINKFFEIIYETKFTDTITSLQKQYPRIEEVVDDLNWACQKNPLILGQVIEQEEVYEARIIHTLSIGETPAFWVLILIDKKEEHVTFIAIQPLEENQSN